MCLDIVSATYKKPLQEERVAYKVFYKDSVGVLMTPCQYVILQPGEWKTDSSKRQLMSFLYPPKNYQTGYHCWATRRGARRDRRGRQEFTVRKVLIQGIVAEGEQDRQNVVVARKIKVLSGKV